MAVGRQAAQGAIPPHGRLAALVLSGFFLRVKPGLVSPGWAEYSSHYP